MTTTSQVQDVLDDAAYLADQDVAVDVPCDRVLAVPGDRADLGDRDSALHLLDD